MRLPRRTPSRCGTAELQDMYARLYPRGGVHAIAIDDAYRAERSAGLAHCRVWLHRGACPYAVESTMALIEAQQLDERLLFLQDTDGGSSSTSVYAVRTAYAMAVVRFVNSLADAMQTGLYAQSIFRIADRIGLPAWFVELRHAATHEELPTLDVLRHASVEALAWLQANFWQPNVQRDVGTSSGAAMQPDEKDVSDSATLATRAILDDTAQTLRGHVAAYRRLAKQVVRDASLRGPNKAAMSVVQSRIVACVRQADVVVSQRTPATQRQDDTNGYEAADVLAAVLLEPGGLVPLSRHKRVRATEQEAVAALPSVLAETWLPLLQYLTDAMDAFAQALLDELLDRVTANEHGSLVDMAASWLTYLLTDEARTLFDRKGGKVGLREDGSMDRERQSVTVVRRCLVQPTRSSIAVAQHLCAQSASLMDRLGHLLALAVPLSDDGLHSSTDRTVVRTATTDTPVDGDVAAAGDETMTDLERSLEAMERQLQALHDKGLPSATAAASTHDDTLSRRIEAQRQETCTFLTGWTLAAAHEWRPTPIGCLDGGVPTLEL